MQLAGEMLESGASGRVASAMWHPLRVEKMKVRSRRKKQRKISQTQGQAKISVGVRNEIRSKSTYLLLLLTSATLISAPALQLPWAAASPVEELPATSDEQPADVVHHLPDLVASSATRSQARRDHFSSDQEELANQQRLFQEEDQAKDEYQLLQQPFDYHSSMPVITKRELAGAIKRAEASVRQLRDSLEVELLEDKSFGAMELGSPGWLAKSMFHKPALDERLLNQTNQALISEEATRVLAKHYKLTRMQVLRGLPLISVDLTNLGKLCPKPGRTFNCLPGMFRSLTGHCNNVQNPDWGAAQTALVRYASARYLDYIAKPLRASTKTFQTAPPGHLLPSARAVSNALYGSLTAVNLQTNNPQENNMQHSHMTTMMSFFGQFIFHDLAYVSQYGPIERHSIKCCATTSISPLSKQHPECLPIELREQDYCLDYVRSTPAVRIGCNLGPRDQLNLVSSYLDGSAIYGSNEQQARSLRTFVGGRLRSQRVANGGAGSGSNAASLELLPQIAKNQSSTSHQQGNSNNNDLWWAAADEDCRQMAQMRRKAPSIEDQGCFQAGDNRVNENIGLTLMHTIWMREHNHIADKLAAINKHWRDERLYEETRRIVIAQLQHITYSEFLPSVLGDEVMQKFNLSTLTQGYAQTYDPQLNAGTSNELATAVFPFILSTMPSSLERYSDRLEILGHTSLADTFMDGSDLLKRNRFAQYLMGMISQNAMEPVLGVMPITQPMDSSNLIRFRRQTGGTTNTTAKDEINTVAPQVDIVALTIQQGRDHGLKPYLYWRQMCQLKPVIKSWQDLGQVMPLEVVERLRKLYPSVDQLDLYLGQLESPLPGATLGPTFVCLLARQFFHLKHGDRYWYENDLPGSSFTSKQLDEIRQTSLAKVVCRNSQSSISFIQPAPMITSDPYLNAYQYCSNKAMGQLDLSMWRQSVTSAQQLTQELLLNQDQSPLTRARRLIESQPRLVSRSIRRARRQLDQMAYDETVQMRRKSPSPSSSSSMAAGYRYLPRLKRHTLKLNNQSLIYELATNEVVRSLLRQGKDREQAQSIQSDIREFLNSLESVQLDNLLTNSGDSNRLADFIQHAGNNFLTQDQRRRLELAGDPLLASDLELTAEQPSATSLRSSSVSANCQDDDRAFPCDHTSPFRTITGWCNNLQNPKFGQSFTPHDRILANAYEDGLAKPRQFSVLVASQQTGERLLLPSPRLISTTMHDDKSQLHSRYSLALMQFGQFGVDHDLTRTPFSVALDGSLLDCSPCDSKRTVHRDCLPIEIPENDAHFQSPKAKELSGPGKRCLHFVRSLNGQTGLGPRQQINALTSYFDASNIYGSDNCEAKSLRSFQGGRLNSSAYPAQPGFPNQQAREILPVTQANPECVTPGGLCFHAGDQRASEQPGLTAIHTIFMRLHNTIVVQLNQINRHWSDEKLYQHGRRIVGAIMQRITYNEFVPRLLGLDYVSKFELMLKQVGYSDQYDETCSASILNEFAAAAFRMGHSLIRNAFPLLNKQYKPIGKAFQLRKAFFNSQRILTEPNLIDSILRGVVSTPIETLDNAITDELTNHLFERPKEPFSGMDLISLNIQRARDHGIGAYNRYRVKCNLTKAKSFEDLQGEIPQKLVKRLSGLYASVDDIDLFTGGMSELPVHGGIIGPTLGCIIGIQLSHPAQPGFPNQQAREILPVTQANPECVTPGGLCFHAGDQRASEQPGLTAIHTIFMRLHNTIVVQLNQINRHWSDEKLYQHGRRIVGAIMQRITYNEFVPRLLGLDYVSKFELMLKQVGYSDQYDETCSASILNEFAAAAFRMGHSLIRNAFPLLNKQYKPIGKAFQLRKAFFNSQRILTEPNLIDSILRGVVSTPIETLDNAITDELTNHLFERPKEPFSGMDLISLNIQRARDHGIGAYNRYRVKCNLTKAKSFEDLQGEIPQKLVKRLSGLYASVDDIDLFTGGMSELPVHGGIIGPTLGCIIGIQLSRLKRCDRFWHETSDPWVRFSPPQLAEIRKMTLAKVICQESDNIDVIQRQAMDVPDHYLNPRVACSSLPTLDLSVWRENLKTCQVNKVKLELGQSKRINPCKSCTCTGEGPVCRTAKINCLQVMKQANLSAIMADKSCLVQCAWALDMAAAQAA